MATFDLGRVTPIYKGDYNAATSYELNDVVLYDGNLYWHHKPTATVGVLPTDTTVWGVVFTDEGVRAEIRGYADNAQNSADSALASKSAAATSASQASASASQAALSAQTAQTAATGATASAQSAATSAQTAKEQADISSAKAAEAFDNATYANQRASYANESASIAHEAKSAAISNAQIAVAKADEARNSATQAASSATSAQEYDESAQQSSVNAQTSATNAAASEAAAKRYAEDSAAYLGAYPTDTAEGEIASFSDGADAPMKSLVVGIEPAQDLHGYDNPWPAGGGVNLLPPHSQPSVTNNGVTLTNSNGEYTLNGTTSSGVAVFDIRASFPAGQYAVALNNPTANSNVQIYGVDENNAVPMQATCSTANSATTATFESTVAIFRIRVLRYVTVDNFKLSPVFSVGATAATKFYPYSNICPISGWTGTNIVVSPTTDAEDGDTYPISFPTEAGTVYGGKLDVLTGVLTVDMTIVDMGTLNWTYYSNKQRFVAQANSGKPAGINAGLDGACSVYKVVNTRYNDMPDKSILIGNNFISNAYAAMVVFDSAYTDAETFKTAVSGQTLVFPIKNPIVYQLTPTEVKSLLGANNIWADTGDANVVYRADTSAYIAKKIAEAISALS